MQGECVEICTLFYSVGKNNRTQWRAVKWTPHRIRRVKRRHGKEKHLTLEVEWHRFKCHLSSFIAVWLKESYVTSLFLSFLVCQMEIAPSSSK